MALVTLLLEGLKCFFFKGGLKWGFFFSRLPFSAPVLVLSLGVVAVAVVVVVVVVVVVTE